ncbi:MAG: Bax inhibitor-1/YccA family protein [Candidatus Omnitrophica bacterium]|nr:Bax inhibitor-1/YccA family protein [Candidatus Omnitrophota bacterium]
MQSSNPVLKNDVFAPDAAYSGGAVMTVQGTVNKSFVLLGLLVVAAVWVWMKIMAPVSAGTAQALVLQARYQSLMPYIMVGGIGGFILAIITVFKKEWVAYTAPVYAVFEGVVLGALSAIMEMYFPGIVVQAIGLTFGTLFCLLLAYTSGMIKVTEGFRTGIVIATGAIGLIYLATWILGMFHVNIPFIHESGPIGIAFSLFVVGIAAMNLLLDFDFIERGADQGAPKYMEWYGAFSLMVTLVWLYMEILRLLAKLRSRD